MTDRKTARILSLALAASFLLVACGPPVQKSDYFGKVDPPEGQTLRYISGSEPESLDPQMSTGQPEARLDIALYEGLVEYHPKTMEPIPGVAESWKSNGNAS
ncbi:MAG: hypothetical protein ACJ754_26800, partial [Pyrinomonadaceae bacterium]